MRRIVREFNPDILETHNIKSHFLVRADWFAAANFPGSHGTTATPRRTASTAPTTRLDRWSLRGAFRLMTVCGPFAAAMQKLGIPRDKITVLHNFVDAYVRPRLTMRCCGFDQQMGLGDELVIVTIGRMSVEKGHANLLHAIALLKDSARTSQASLRAGGRWTGGGESAPPGRELGIEDRLVWTGFQKNVAPYYAMANIYALPSHLGRLSQRDSRSHVGRLCRSQRHAREACRKFLRTTSPDCWCRRKIRKLWPKPLQKLLLSEELRARLASAACRQVETAHTLAGLSAQPDAVLCRDTQDAKRQKLTTRLNCHSFQPKE